ncbi:hypothetical protein [Rhizobium esperanzae]|uniref:Uncharacterized protein n=1 Tax=Rhizobium esperanzae TaxID=1967781 RepID=A0A7W6QZY7_9HYPH|nr:hypothetical protein [Rhizobium esperanzae]MBB4234066.1 hypothetical protein [Rhizobium esperanzae]
MGGDADPLAAKSMDSRTGPILPAIGDEKPAQQASLDCGLDATENA